MQLSKIIVITTVLFTALSCHTRDFNKPLNVDAISLEYSELPLLPIDSVVTNVRFVRLETNTDCLIESYDEIQIVDDRIFIRSSKRSQQSLFVFDMEGNHLLTINAQGRGPGEYLALRGFTVSPESKEICLLDLAQVLIYDYCGSHLRSHSFDKLGLFPCDISPSLISFNGYYYMIVETFETKGIDPVKGWGTELMEDDMFNLVAVFDKDWRLISRTYPIPRERSGQHYRFQLTIGKQNSVFISDAGNLWYHSVFSDYLYEVIDHKFIPQFRLEYGRHKIPEESRREASKIHESQAMNYIHTFFNGNYGFPGTRYSVRDSQILLQPTIGRAEPLILFDRRTNKSLVLAMTQSDEIGNMANLYPTSGIQSYYGGFFGHLPSERHVWVRDMGREYCRESLLSPLNFPEYDQLTKEDNGVILFFELKKGINY